MAKVSVLVPVYNVEKYLADCLDSIVGQSEKDLEIICVNDGSTDSSLKILQTYAQQDSRIQIVDKKNSGYGDSLNRALTLATGDYVAIVEPDDFIAKKAFAELYALAKSTKADVVRANYYRYSAQKKQKQNILKDFPLDTPRKLADDYRVLLLEPAIWAQLYRRDFLQKNNIRFLATPGASYQDAGFNLKALVCAKTLAYTDKAYLHYRVDNAASSVKDQSKVDCILKEFASVEKFLDERQAPERLCAYVQAAKFGSYHWNLQRLDTPLALDFCARIKREFKRAAKANLLDRNVFPRHYWLALQLILKFPPRVYVSILKSRQKLKK